jgi:DNA-binding PadR family transcriptional regulator
MALAHAILAALMDCPCSGYDLRKRFESSVGFFWQASFQQIYRELDKLAEQGLVQSEAITQQARPDKKLFAVTESGQALLQAWLQEPCELPPLRDALLVKMFAGFLVPRETMLAQLQAHRQLHQERLAVYQQIQQQSFSQPSDLPEPALYRYLTLRNGMRLEAEWLNWCDEAMDLLAQSKNVSTTN